MLTLLLGRDNCVDFARDLFICNKIELKRGICLNQTPLVSLAVLVHN